MCEAGGAGDRPNVCTRWTHVPIGVTSPTAATQGWNPASGPANLRGMGRRIVGVIAGLATAASVMMAVGAVSAWIYPLPPGLDPKDPDILRAHIATLPAGAFLIVLLAAVLASLAGGAVATAITRGAEIRPAVVVGLVLTVGGAFNLASIPHPTWFALVSMVTYLPCACLGGFFFLRGPGDGRSHP